MATMLTYPDEDDAPAAQPPSLPGVPFIDADPHQCRWPLWEADTDPRHVCGALREPDAPYRREHRRRAFERKAATHQRL
jgi:hypothetical protein